MTTTHGGKLFLHWTEQRTILSAKVWSKFNRAAAWIDCPYTFKIYELPGGKNIYESNGTFYRDTNSSHKVLI